MKIRDKDLPLIWQLSWKLAVCCVVIFVAGCFFTDVLSWGIGVLLGGGFTVVRLVMMQKSIERSVHMDPQKSSRYARAQYVVRYFLSAAVLIVAAVTPWINPISTVLAMISLKLVTYIQGWLDKKYYPDQPETYVEWEEEEEDEDWDRWEAYAIRSGRIRKQMDKINELSRPPLQSAKDQEEFGGEQLSLLDQLDQEQ